MLQLKEPHTQTISKFLIASYAKEHEPRHVHQEVYMPNHRTFNGTVLFFLGTVRFSARMNKFNIMSEPF